MTGEADAVTTGEAGAALTRSRAVSASSLASTRACLLSLCSSHEVEPKLFSSSPPYTTTSSPADNATTAPLIYSISFKIMGQHKIQDVWHKIRDLSTASEDNELTSNNLTSRTT
jgi:hypothetical protein